MKRRTYLTPNQIEKHMLIDGYNVINMSKSLKEIAKDDFELGRNMLISALLEYCKMEQYIIYLVFDAQYTEDKEKIETINKDLHIIYTNKGETADSFIEKMVYTLSIKGRKEVYVVTSDGAQQNMILGSGAFRIPARELLKNIKIMKKNIKKEITSPENMIYKRDEVGSRLDKEVLEKLEEIRRNHNL